MMFQTQTEARQFFIGKVMHQAQIEGMTLSADEQQMLSWSESAPDSVAGAGVVERLAAEISDDDYEAKIAGLLRRRFVDDVAADRHAKDLWRDAWSVLNQGDHYIGVMIDQAIGNELKSGWKFW